jgi:hypothetical protein
MKKEQKLVVCTVFKMTNRHTYKRQVQTLVPLEIKGALNNNTTIGTLQR